MAEESKTIVAEVTIHYPGPSYAALKINEATGRPVPGVGKYDVIAVEPGKPVTLSAEDADKLIARGVAKEYVAEVIEATKVAVATSTKPGK